MSRFDRLRTPLKNARGLGAAKTGVGHFIAQRATSIALVFLMLYALVLVVGLLGSGYTEARAAVAHPFNAALLIALVIAMLWHGQLGMQVLIEDYVHTPLMAMVAQISLRFVCILAGLAGVLAIIRITSGT